MESIFMEYMSLLMLKLWKEVYGNVLKSMFWLNTMSTYITSCIELGKYMLMVKLTQEMSHDRQVAEASSAKYMSGQTETHSLEYK